MLQDSDEEKLSRIFMILFEKKVAKRSANHFEDSQVGRVVLWDLCRTLCNSHHSFFEFLYPRGSETAYTELSHLAPRP